MKKKYWLIALYTGLFIVLNSCQTVLMRNAPPLSSTQESGEIAYSLIYVIHGDGSYLYHDADGTPHQADERMVAQAISVAEKVTNGEVFIYHQKPKRRLLFFIPLKDGDFYYYRRGKRIAKEAYSRTALPAPLAKEAQFFETYRTQRQGKTGDDSLKNIFLYYGHEIPEFSGAGYHKSYPKLSFTVDHLAEGLKRFQEIVPGRQRTFDIALLSTCNNGTPGSVARLAPFCDYLIASPENLHLSYVDSHILGDLDKIGHRDNEQIAGELASRAFDRLVETAQTAVTISLYDTRKAAEFLNAVAVLYDSLTTIVQQQARMDIECFDCNDVNSVFEQTADSGVRIFYRPPRFGKYKRKKQHSGWGCWRLRSSID